MNYFRNILLFALFAMITAGCGGGNTTVTSNYASGDTNTSNTTSTNSTSTASTTLHWSAPSTRTDGSSVSLPEISSYRLYYGPSATNTPNSINISDGTATQYTVTLPAGTYYFRIAAIDTNGYTGLLSTALKITL